MAVKEARKKDAGRKRRTKGKDESKPPTEPAGSNKGTSTPLVRSLGSTQIDTPAAGSFNVLQFSYFPFLSRLYLPTTFVSPLCLSVADTSAPTTPADIVVVVVAVSGMQTAKLSIIVYPDARRTSEYQRTRFPLFLPFSSPPKRETYFRRLHVWYVCCWKRKEDENI